MRPGLQVLIAAVLVTLLAGAGALGGDLLGYSGAEVHGHAWVQWWHGEALPAWPGGTSLAAGAEAWPVIDPLTTGLGAVLGRSFGYTAGWNLVVLLGVFGAFLGGAALARREGGNPLVGGVVVALGPAFLGSAASGLTEDLALGLLAGALAVVLGPGMLCAVLGGLMLGLLAWCGPYLAWMGAVVALGLGLAQWRRWKHWLVAGAVALAVALPAAWLQADRAGDAAGVTVEQHEPQWRINPWRGADLASFVTPGRVTPEGLVRIHPGYLGFVALGLGLLGGRSRWWFVLLGALLLAPGDALRFAGEPLGVSNPFAWLLDRMPFGSAFHHHGRFLLVGSLGLAVVASRVAQRWPRWGWALALAVALEVLLLSPAPLPLPTAESEVDPIWFEVTEGPVVPVPSAGPGVHFQAPLYAQRAHGQVLEIVPNRPGLSPAVQGTELGRWLGHPVGPPPEVTELPWTLVVREDLVPTVEAALGPPDVEASGGAIWRQGS